MVSILLYAVIINIIGYIIMGLDKKKAKSGAWRISEDNLLLVALLGGSVGMYWGIKKYRHKTRHIKFSVGVPLIFLLQIAVILWLLYQKISFS